MQLRRATMTRHAGSVLILTTEDVFSIYYLLVSVTTPTKAIQQNSDFPQIVDLSKLHTTTTNPNN